MKPHVFIITCTRHVDQLTMATSLLTFRTVRAIGFPTADITVIDNGSREAAQEEIEFLAEQCIKADYKQFPRQTHSQIIEWILDHYPQDKVVIVDPDCIFWHNCEQLDSKWHPQYLMAGRLIPRHWNEYTKCLELARLHTSFLWINKPQRLFDHIFKQSYNGCNTEYSPVDFIKPCVNFVSGEPYFWDTMCQAFQSLQSPLQSVQFGEQELDCYDHLFCGSSLDIAKQYLQEGHKLEALHQLTLNGDDSLECFRGIYRQQEQYLKTYAR